MPVCVCMCVHMCVCVACMHVYLCACMPVCLYMRMQVCLFDCVRMYICMHAGMHVMYVCTSVGMSLQWNIPNQYSVISYVYIRIYIYDPARTSESFSPCQRNLFEWICAPSVVGRRRLHNQVLEERRHWLVQRMASSTACKQST